MDHAGGRLCGGGACLPGVSPVQQRRGADSGGAFAVDDSPHGEFRHERQVHHRAQHFFYHAANGRRECEPQILDAAPVDLQRRQAEERTHVHR